MSHSRWCVFVCYIHEDPTHFDEQAQYSNSADARNQYNSSFVFNTLDIFGVQRQSIYQLSPDYEGTLLFFPSQLNHMVYPYYNCEEQRITVSGNIWYKKLLNHNH